MSEDQGNDREITERDGGRVAGKEIGRDAGKMADRVAGSERAILMTGSGHLHSIFWPPLTPTSLLTSTLLTHHPPTLTYGQNTYVYTSNSAYINATISSYLTKPFLLTSSRTLINHYLHYITYPNSLYILCSFKTL